MCMLLLSNCTKEVYDTSIELELQQTITELTIELRTLTDMYGDVLRLNSELELELTQLTDAVDRYEDYLAEDINYLNDLNRRITELNNTLQSLSLDLNYYSPIVNTIDNDIIQGSIFRLSFSDLQSITSWFAPNSSIPMMDVYSTDYYTTHRRVSYRSREPQSGANNDIYLHIDFYFSRLDSSKPISIRIYGFAPNRNHSYTGGELYLEQLYTTEKILELISLRINNLLNWTKND
jgi:regulator of replication initiation timing